MIVKRWDVHCNCVGCQAVLACDGGTAREALEEALAAGWEVAWRGTPGYIDPRHDHHFCPACAKSMRRKEANADGGR